MSFLLRRNRRWLPPPVTPHDKTTNAPKYHYRNARWADDDISISVRGGADT